MEPRFDIKNIAPGIYYSMFGLERYLHQCGLEESPFYSERERAALEWSEAVTRISDGHVRDEIYEKVKKQFTVRERSIYASPL